MGYGVRIVADDAMPEDREWLFLEKTDGSLVLWLTYSSAASPRALSSAWAAYRRIQSADVPEQRRPRDD